VLWNCQGFILPGGRVSQHIASSGEDRMFWLSMESQSDSFSLIQMW
jgi:hypothetical protein